MSEPFLGEIRMAGFNFAPRGWAFCNGQILSIAQNTALFSLLGTTFGGNGQTTFALPNMQSRMPMHWGQGAGLSSRSIGEQSGTESVTLITNQMPAHNHTLNVADEEGNSFTPGGRIPAATVVPPSTNANSYFNGAANAAMSPNAVSVVGGSQPHDNMPPYLCVTFIIALEGIFPSRN